jgi:Cu(I)/Ag(I) efflux system membrane fusion protein
MNSRTWTLAALTVAAAAALGAGAWWIGMQQGMAMMAAPEAVASAGTDPAQWSIPQGEQATRRHLRDGLKAGDMDPVTGQRIRNYHDPMVPGKNFDAPGKSPFMEMMLVPRYEGGDAGADNGSVSVSPRIQQNLGLRTAPVVEGTLASEVAAAGSVSWNERDQVQVASRAMGFVEKLHVRAAFDRVAAGAPLVTLHVPDWVAAQEEYLAVARMTGPDTAPLRDAATARMRQAGMSDGQVEAVVASQAVQPRVTLRAPIGGIVAELMVREGAAVMPGMTLLRLQGTGTVWAEGQVPESQTAALRAGMRVAVVTPALPGQTFDGRLQALLPEVDAATRTRKARLELPNRDGRLVPGMQVQMRFAGAERKRLQVPSDAVIQTGRRSVVMLAEDGGRFRPVEVTIGLEADGRTEIASGLQAGQRVVLSGQFLIDSEASLRGLEARLNEAPPSAPSEPTR